MAISTPTRMKSPMSGEKNDTEVAATSAPFLRDDEFQETATKTRRHSRLHRWMTIMLMLSYFIFSVAFYTVIGDYARKVFWFLCLTVATCVAGVTALEAYDGLTPLREARKAIEKTNFSDWSTKESNDKLPHLHLIFDSGDEVDRDDLNQVIALADELKYPIDKLDVSILNRGPPESPGSPIDYFGEARPGQFRFITLPHSASQSLAARIAFCMARDSPKSASAITAIFREDERPHPHAVRYAVERFLQNPEIDLVQGRSLLMPQSARFSLLFSMSSLLNDLVQALLQPGRSRTWGLAVPGETNAYWRTEALRAATSSALAIQSDGLDLPYATVARHAGVAYDLRVIAFIPAPTTIRNFTREQLRAARHLAVACVRHVRLAFSWRSSKEGQPEWSLKKRFALLYHLVVMRLAAHTVLQYFCLALAVLIVDTPHSAHELAKAIYFPYPISEWLIISGLLCLVATVGMIYTARSEFVSTWTAPLMLVMYPLILLCHAFIDVYGQAQALAT